ncbi:MAG: 6-carboxytetrahydropterin synthase [Pseudomonadota bacterium]
MRDQLDHNYLNEIDGLERPTLEVICRWIWGRLKPDIPKLHRVTVRRGTCGEGCVYEG